MEGYIFNFDEETVLRAAVKYGRAVAHAFQMYQAFRWKFMETAHLILKYLWMKPLHPPQFPNTFYIAHELKRLGVHWVSLAPRYVGRFEKGVDYIGDLAELDRTMGLHAAIMRSFGSYKLSLHSGSDKFSVYPIAAKHAHGLVHLKTAGTSYLEALRVIARLTASYFMKIYEFARDRYETDRASYHVSAELAKLPPIPMHRGTAIIAGSI